jgi:gliding motility-associated-like protein
VLLKYFQAQNVELFIMINAMSKKIIITFISVLLINSTALFGQISSPNASFKVATEYSRHDSIFVFYKNQSANLSLKATTPGGLSSTFEWSSYDTLNRKFGSTVFTETDVATSTIKNLKEGGYKVHVTRSGFDTTMIAWLFLDSLSMSVEKNNAGELLFYRRTCEYINLQATSTPTSYKYFNPNTGTALKLNNKLIFTWNSSPAIPNGIGEGGKIWIEGEDIPNEDTEFTGRATDLFGLYKEDNVKYISIVPKADFESQYDKNKSDIISSPLTVTFTNNSKNAAKYTWIFGDADTLYLNEPERDPEPHIYYISSTTYKIKLIAASKEGCEREDTASITVDKSVIEVPNVFTPNGDGDNDIFFIKNASLREFHLTIYSRTGRKVYEFDGPDINNWEGWDGRMGNTELSPGIYYYVIDAKSWEAPSVKYTPKKQGMSGFFYLYR